MRHEDRGEAALALDTAQLDLHLLAQAAVERRQRLVQQQHARLGDDRPRQCHPLLLPARKLAGLARIEAGETNKIERTLSLAPRCRAPDAPAAQPVGNVLDHCHVRKQRVGLEHHADPATPQRLMRDVGPADRHRAGVRGHKAADHAQQRRLAGA